MARKLQRQQEPGGNEPRAAMAIEEVNVTFFEADVDARAYAQRHVEVSGLSAEQARTLKRRLAGADRQGLRLASGKRVVTAADLVRWWLEN